MSAVGRLLRGENDIDFRIWWKRGAVLSLVMLIASVGSLAFRGLELSVEFTGGVSVEAETEGVSVDEARALLADEGLGTARVQVISDLTGREMLRVQTSEDGEEVQQSLRQSVAELAGADLTEVSVSSVSASWGADVTNQAARALVFFLLAILVYLTLRLELRMAVGALIATLFNVVVTVGVYSILGFEVTPGTVTAFLMVLGYSIYDTVVVYDKVKEKESLVGVTHRFTYTQMVSRAMNVVLMRSINTSITTLLPLLSLLLIGSMLMGAVTLSQFALALAVGLVVGSYASIMVAAPALAYMKEREPRYAQLRERLGGTATPVVKGAPASEASTDEAPGDASPHTAAETPPARGRSDAKSGPTPAGTIPPRPRKKSRRR